LESLQHYAYFFSTFITMKVSPFLFHYIGHVILCSEGYFFRIGFIIKLDVFFLVFDDQRLGKLICFYHNRFALLLVSQVMIHNLICKCGIVVFTEEIHRSLLISISRVQYWLVIYFFLMEQSIDFLFQINIWLFRWTPVNRYRF
jgi:hypothetical protein